jgi:ribonuclease HI
VSAADADRVIANFDGGSRGNPGQAAIAAVLTAPDGSVLAERGEAIGVATNNVAEYRALLLAVQLASELAAGDVELIGDSELIVRQVKGEYRVKDNGLKELHAQARRALDALGTWTIRSVRREENAAADRLVNETLDKARS